MRQFKFNVLFFAFLLLSACSLFINGNISSRAYGPVEPNPTFSFFNEEQLIGLTPEIIKEKISEKLTFLGFRQVDANANYLVVFSYKVGDGVAEVSSQPDFVFGGQQVSSHSSYPRHFQILIVDRIKSIEKNKLVYLWQSEIYSSGSSANMSYLGPKFVEEMFQYFGKDVQNQAFSIAPS